MKPAAAWAGALGAAAMVWSLAEALPAPARLLTAIMLGPVPVAFMLQSRAAQKLPLPIPRIQIYMGSIFGLLVIGGVSYAAGRYSGFDASSFGLQPITPATFVAWTAALMAAAALIVAAFKALGLRESDMMRDIIPDTTKEKLTFCLLSICAGVCEEIAFRGFLLTSLFISTGSAAAAVVLSSTVFGLVHAHQNSGGAARAGLLGAILCMPLLLTGSIYPSIAAHILVDVAGGLWLGRWLIR